MIASICLFLLCAFLTWKINQRNQHSLSLGELSIAYSLKIAGGFGFYALYAFYYGNGTLVEDAGSFLREADIINNTFSTNFDAYWSLMTNAEDCEDVIFSLFVEYDYSRYAHPTEVINSTRNIIKLISVLLLVTGGAWINVFILFGHLLLWSILVLFSNLRSKHGTLLKWSWILFFTPSFLLYSSSILKEVMGCIGLVFVLIAFVQGLSSKRSLVLIMIGLLIMLPFKPIWTLFCLSAGLMAGFVYVLLHKNWKWKSICLVALGLLLISPLANYGLKKISHKQFDFINIAEGGIYLASDENLYRLERSDSIYLKKIGLLYTPIKELNVQVNPLGKKGDFINGSLPAFLDTMTLTYSMDKPVSAFPLSRINGEWFGLAKTSIEAIGNVWFRPFWSEQQSFVLKLGLFMENIFFLLSFVFILGFIFKARNLNFTNLFVLALILVFTLAIGWVTPVSGAIIRYRIPIHLLLMIGLLLNFSNTKFKWTKNTFL